MGRVSKTHIQLVKEGKARAEEIKRNRMGIVPKMTPFQVKKSRDPLTAIQRQRRWRGLLRKALEERRIIREENAMVEILMQHFGGCVTITDDDPMMAY